MATRGLRNVSDTDVYLMYMYECHAHWQDSRACAGWKWLFLLADSIWWGVCLLSHVYMHVFRYIHVFVCIYPSFCAAFAVNICMHVHIRMCTELWSMRNVRVCMCVGAWAYVCVCDCAHYVFIVLCEQQFVTNLNLCNWMKIIVCGTS